MGAVQLSPFVPQFHGNPSCLWTDDMVSHMGSGRAKEGSKGD